jgi:hypothetical protein
MPEKERAIAFGRERDHLKGLWTVRCRIEQELHARGMAAEDAEVDAVG